MGLGADVGSHCSIVEGLHRFFEMHGSWVDAGYHRTIRVASNGLLQKGG